MPLFHSVLYYLQKNSTETFPTDNGTATISESFALNLIISVSLTNK